MAAQIGLVGLGVMGANLALNMAEKGFRVAVFNRTADVTEAFMQDAGTLRGNLVACDSLEHLVGQLQPPRAIVLMVKAGPPVDELAARLTPLLQAGDILVDAGNANFHDTVRRTAELAKAGLLFAGVGVSGGEEGARLGPSIMAGGDKAAYARLEPVLTAIAARFEGAPCAAWLGPDGAGHFVKTIHNGIEYADMQMIAEIYGVMRDGLAMPVADSAAMFKTWNAGVLNSFLIEITAKVLAVADPATGKPLIDVIVDKAAQKGTGKWAVIEAQDLGLPASVMEAAVAARVLSSLKSERMEAAAVYGGSGQRPSPVQGVSPADLESALYAGKIIAYAQGFAVMQAASVAHRWGLPLGRIAEIWRAGCIIRSAFLGDIAATFGTAVDGKNLLLSPFFAKAMTARQQALRRVVAVAVGARLPVPALSAALAYFDSYRQARGTANLIQAQRDFFGAHSFERVDQAGSFHGPWAAG